MGEGESAAIERPFHICRVRVNKSVGRVANGITFVEVVVVSSGRRSCTHHECCGHHQREVEQLRSCLPRVLQA